MTPFQMSLLSWLAGGVVGSALSKKHRVVGFALGAIAVGAVADVMIERRLPYVPIFARSF
jgi:hypothetical protein